MRLDSTYAWYSVSDTLQYTLTQERKKSATANLIATAELNETICCADFAIFYGITLIGGLAGRAG